MHGNLSVIRYSNEHNKVGGGTREHKVHELGWDTRAQEGHKGC